MLTVVLLIIIDSRPKSKRDKYRNIIHSENGVPEPGKIRSGSPVSISRPFTGENKLTGHVTIKNPEIIDVGVPLFVDQVF